jgi:hypothetical protein
MTRLFVAIDLSDDTRRAIATEQKRLAAALRDMKAVRWVQPAQMHVTLVFLGEVEDARTPSVVEAAGRAVEMPAFDPTFEGVGRTDHPAAGDRGASRAARRRARGSAVPPALDARTVEDITVVGSQTNDGCGAAGSDRTRACRVRDVVSEPPVGGGAHLHRARTC